MDDLRKRALVGLARFQAFLAALIFLPAWSLTYWQGLLYWLVFGTLCLVLSLYFLRHDPALVARRMQAGPAAESAPRQKIIMTLASLALVALYPLCALDHRFGWSQVPAAVTLAAELFVALGFYGLFVTFRANPFTASTVRVEPGQRLARTGPYAIVRHPMYAACLPLFLATPPALDSWFGLIPAAALIGAIVWRLIDEERHLARELAGYEDYRREVRARLLPGVW
jgi:protein-S-isoprenylcysteine O-methyltransferase Ste14